MPEKLEFDFTDEQYSQIDRIKETVRLKKSDNLKKLAVERKHTDRADNVDLYMKIPRKLHERLKEESEETGMSMQKIIMSLLVKRYRILTGGR